VQVRAVQDPSPSRCFAALEGPPRFRSQASLARPAL